MNPDDLVFALIPLVVIVGLLVLAALAIIRSTRLRELKHQQWIAMVEKGILPPPEVVGPAMFDGVPIPLPRRAAAAERFRSAGVIFMGLGLAIALIIGVAASQPRVGVGIGGAVAIVGAALFVNGLLVRGHGGDEPPASMPGTGPTPGGL